MAKFDLAKYWDFRTWVKSQIAQLRALISEYQQSGGGNTGGSGSSDFDPAGTYPNMTVGKASKADTATRATNADNATKATSATTANQATSADTATNIANAPVLAATEDEQITVKVGNKTSNALTVPYAQRADFATDLSGRVEATPEVFTYRPSAGDKSIKDDNAYIRRIKGNSIVLRQIVPDTLTIQDGTGSYENGVYTITPTGDYPGIKGYFNELIPDGHKLLFSIDMRLEGVISPRIQCNIQGFNKEIYYDQHTSGLTNVSTILTITGARNSNIIFFSYASATQIQLARPQLIDLTAMFGEGNEPATVEEFRYLFPRKFYSYTKGTLLNLLCYGIRTIGFNEFNGVYAKVLRGETYYLGGEYTSIGFTAELGCITETITIPSHRLYTPTEIGYIYATGSAICINLSHTGYRDGEYEPYKEVTHTLPLSQITNGQPLRKAGGDVYDEVNNDYYIRRVGVRSYTTGDKDDAALLTDGTHTNYPLDEPIYTPINTPIDFNYYVEDFGTEEALLQEDSAPFSADIVYQFNATDQIRNNYRNIQWLKKSAFVPSGTAAQYIRGDGSYGDVTELSHGTPIHDGEYEMPDEGDYDMQFTLTPSYYAKSPRELDDTTTIAVFVTAPDDSNYLAEYWFEFAVGETLPNIEYYQPNNSDAVFRINGNLMTYAVNVLHLISSDGGITFYGDITNYSI